MSTSTLRVIQIIKRGLHTYIIVSDGRESERDSSFEGNELFKKLCEDFLHEKYGDHISILSSTIDHMGGTQGSAWVKVDPKTSGILEMIAEEYGLTIEKN